MAAVKETIKHHGKEEVHLVRVHPGAGLVLCQLQIFQNSSPEWWLSNISMTMRDHLEDLLKHKVLIKSM